MMLIRCNVFFSFTCGIILAMTTTALSLQPNRRQMVRQLFSGPLLAPLAAQAQTTDATITTAAELSETRILRVPLRYIPSLSAYVVYYAVGGARFGAILDTGSPFLNVPAYCNEQKWGCFRPQDSVPSGLAPTYERFDNNEGWVEWRQAPFGFVGAEGSILGRSQYVFGVLSESLLDGPGGVFLGLVRDTESWIRPSFLGQTQVRSFQIDLSEGNQKSLRLTNAEGVVLLNQRETSQSSSSSSSLSTAFNNDSYIPLVRDLNRRYKDPAYHYTAKALSMRANGSPVLADSRQPIYVIFDTGVSGCVVTSEILEDRYTTARRNREKSLWGSVEVDLLTKSGEVVTLRAEKPLATPFGERPWPTFKNAHLIVLGLAFLEGRRMTIDIDEQKLWFD